MSDTAFLDWPFFEDRHRVLARELDAWATQHVPHAHGADVDAECRALVKALGAGGWLRCGLHVASSGPGLVGGDQRKRAEHQERHEDRGHQHCVATISNRSWLVVRQRAGSGS